MNIRRHLLLQICVVTLTARGETLIIVLSIGSYRIRGAEEICSRRFGVINDVDPRFLRPQLSLLEQFQDRGVCRDAIMMTLIGALDTPH